MEEFYNVYILDRYCNIKLVAVEGTLEDGRGAMENAIKNYPRTSVWLERSRYFSDGTNKSSIVDRHYAY